MNIDLENKCKKRKRNIIDELNITIIENPNFINCEICKLPVYNYRCCNQNHVVTCSYECFSVYQLSQKNTYLDEKDRTSFDEKQDKSDDMEIESDHSWTSY